VLARANGIRADLAKLATATDVKEQEKAYASLQTRGAILELLRPGAPPAAVANVVKMLNDKAAAESDEKKRKPFEDAVKKLTDPAVIAAEKTAAPLADGTNPASFQPLLKALGDADGTVAANAAAALGRLGTAVVGPLVALLGQADDRIAYYASQSLVLINRAAVDALIAQAAAGKPGARWAAITLGEIGDQRAVAPLETLSKSADPDTAYAAGAALAKVRAI
jgi:HEAT repeat protein